MTVSNTLKYTPIEAIEDAHATTRKTFMSKKTRPVEYRKTQLRKLNELLSENIPALCQAVNADLSKHPQETTMFEIMALQQHAMEAVELLDEWVKGEEPEAPAPFFTGKRMAIRHEPLGNVLIIAPWNYPLRLTLSPLIGAIAAGCTAVVKPSEVSANTSRVLADLIPKYLDNDAYKIVNGGIPESTKLLELKWDKILYTGNGHVGRIIMTAAAKHLTPVILELGGKSPVIVTKNADIKTAALRITHGKFLNNGQTCIAPDYLLVEKSIKDELIAEIKKKVVENWGENPKESSSYSRVVNHHHWKRVTSLLDRSKGKVLHGNDRDEESLYLAPTIVDLPSAEDSLMEDELFAPILPVVTFENLDETIDLINSKDTPLALYIFTDDEKESNLVLESTRSGGTCVNDVVVHIIPTNLPFGGVGESGMGAYQGKDSFLAFSHRRSTFYNTSDRYIMDDVRTLPYPDPEQATVAQAAE
ncbi:uncharacterized protein SPPG_04046 [Spizellomyces punctatus DAOM BR117]|uniref:Aldehyde dehydrogenase n=1 Tax=Spizellomyces punctatus (strain DAOM BR117) TaxID=645134 RepID=A0A0L0HJ69_SPIPD|nr:uncharacterized protein SPPG_04046 [Spizellomyces punctatus DAOM BR117]KND00945.1 hypothetical protein SPPG_04046 [Spizellomyces punctatus DAOM BR117]|eukprot:XP_016608984.1 hypothetical protein SPPG_04046 [Spizellomyces punctatus DAOM BR117]